VHFIAQVYSYFSLSLSLSLFFFFVCLMYVNNYAHMRSLILLILIINFNNIVYKHMWMFLERQGTMFRCMFACEIHEMIHFANSISRPRTMLILFRLVAIEEIRLF